MPITLSSFGIRSRALYENWVAQRDLSNGGLKSRRKPTLEIHSYMLASALASRQL
jgi:hypothetical protein